jgi:MYXO-CTERM domain-containing protein
MVALGAYCGSGRAADSIWDLQAVDANGEATHPKVGAAPIDTNKVVCEGIALNASDEYLDPGLMFQLYVQGESPDAGGIAVWSGSFFEGGPYSPTWAAEYARMNESGFLPGDRVRVTGFAAFHNGKTNINERHSAAPAMDFTIEVLDAGVGMPAPTVLPSVAACIGFDPARATGGERYQASWCVLEDARIDSMPDGWGAGKTILVTDDGVNTLPVLLSGMGDFDSFVAPTGTFDVVGVFDQEDTTSPFTGDYRLWVKSFGDFDVAETANPVAEPGGLAVAALAVAGLLRRRSR